jgi:CHAT domain-containing protein
MALSQSLTDLGVLARARGDLARAELCLRQGWRIRQHWAPHTLAIADSLHNMGIVYWLRDDLQGAQRFFQPTLSLRRRLAPDSPQLAQSLIWQGLVEVRRARLSAAERHFGQALQQLEKTLSLDNLAVASVLSNLGNVSRSRGELALSQEYYRRALDIQSRQAPDSPAEANSLQALGGLMRQHGDLQGAEGYYRRALKIQEQKTPNNSARAGTLFALASLLRQEKKREDAEPLFAQAADVLERQTDRLGGSPEDRSVFRARYENSYRDYADLLVALGQTDESLRILERARARGLLEMLAEARVAVHGHQPTPQAYAALTQPPTLSARQIQDLLDDDTLLLEYSLGPGAGHVWAITHTTLSVYGLPPRRIVQQAVWQVRELLTARAHRAQETAAQRHRRLRLADARYPAAAQRLSSLVLGPVAPLLENRRIVVVPDGALQYIPFAALPAPSAGALPQAESSHTPLVMQHEVVNLPSASVLAELRQQAQQRMLAPKTVVVLADPVLDEQDERIERPASTGSGAYIDRLPWTRLEAADILKVTPPGEGMQVLDFDASRATALSSLLSQYRIVHFATHAISDAEHPDRSGLVLSLFDRHGLPQNGFLGLEQIYGLNLSADLVVLSACETALGREVDGEGLIGLVHGFMYAGATRVMASLWNVDDEVTAELMAHFYRNLELNASSPAAALRAAQIEVRRQARWSSPYYWAAFQLQGEWRG